MEFREHHGTFPLFRLPPELRNDIYAMVLKRYTDIELKVDNGALVRRNRAAHGPEGRTIALLRVSKATNAEATRHLYDNGIIVTNDSNLLLLLDFMEQNRRHLRNIHVQKWSMLALNCSVNRRLIKHLQDMSPHIIVLTVGTTQILQPFRTLQDAASQRMKKRFVNLLLHGISSVVEGPVMELFKLCYDEVKASSLDSHDG